MSWKLRESMMEAFAEEAAWEREQNEDAPNPVVSMVYISTVEGCEGWYLRIYKDLMIDATNGFAVTLGFDGNSPTWQTDLVACIRAS